MLRYTLTLLLSIFLLACNSHEKPITKTMEIYNMSGITLDGLPVTITKIESNGTKTVKTQKVKNNRIQVTAKKRDHVKVTRDGFQGRVNISSNIIYLLPNERTRSEQLTPYYHEKEMYVENYKVSKDGKVHLSGICIVGKEKLQAVDCTKIHKSIPEARKSHSKDTMFLNGKKINF